MPQQIILCRLWEHPCSLMSRNNKKFSFRTLVKHLILFLRAHNVRSTWACLQSRNAPEYQTTCRASTSVTPRYLVQVSSGVSQEGDGMSCPHADGHSGEAGGRAVQNGFCLHGDSTGHWAGGVVGAAGVGVQGVLIVGIQERPVSVRPLQCVMFKGKKRLGHKNKNNSLYYTCHVIILLSKLSVSPSSEI